MQEPSSTATNRLSTYYVFLSFKGVSGLKRQKNYQACGTHGACCVYVLFQSNFRTSHEVKQSGGPGVLLLCWQLGSADSLLCLYGPIALDFESASACSSELSTHSTGLPPMWCLGSLCCHSSPTQDSVQPRLSYIDLNVEYELNPLTIKGGGMPALA